MIAPIYAANNLIIRADKDCEELTHLKLQKLLYILYARFMAATDSPLYADRFVAWQYGPVLTEIYGVFKDFKDRNISEPQQVPGGGIFKVTEEGDFGNCFSETWEKYGFYPAVKLVNLTHERGSAWAKALERDNGHLGGFLEDEHIREDGRRWFN